VKRQRLDSAKALIDQVATAAKPAFRTLRLGALDSVDTANTAMFPQLPSKLQALYFQLASATAIASVDAQVMFFACSASLHCHGDVMGLYRRHDIRRLSHAMDVGL
jgi:hypothetical protein